MSPLRKWMSQHGLPTWYSWIVLLITVVSCLGLSIIVSVHSAQRAVEAERQARLAAQQAQVEQAAKAIEITCDLFRRQLEAYDETPPPTAAGKNVRNAWLTEYRLYQCQPPR